MRKLFCLALLLGSLFYTQNAHAVGCDGAGNCYIYASATGAGSGADWANAYTGFGTGAGKVNPAAMVRGVTYWIANGSYGNVTFSAADSSTSVITIKGATVASHGTATGWNNSFEGQALFGPSTVSTDYWTFQGQSRGSDWQSGYTIKFWNQSNGSGQALTVGGSPQTNVTLDYVEFEGTGAGFPNNNSTADKCSTDNCGVWADYAIFQSGQNVTNFYVGHSWLHNTGNTQFQMNVPQNHTPVNDTTTFEYNWISYNHTGQNGQHDEAFSLVANNVTIRYNVFQDISGTGIICDASAWAPAMSNWAIYGNFFFNDAAYLALGQVYTLNTVDNGIVALGDGNGSKENLTGTFLFAHNTIANYAPAGLASFNTYSLLAFSGVSGGVGGTGSVIIENNLWYNSAYLYGNYTALCGQLGSCTQDYNASFRGTVPTNLNWQTKATPAAHDYNVSNGATNPFVASQPAQTISGFVLATPDPFTSNQGVSQVSPYDTDLNGVSFGASGIYDMGAEQLISSVPEPTLRGTITLTGGTIQ